MCSTRHKWRGWTVSRICYADKENKLRLDGKYITIFYTDIKKMKFDMRKYPDGDPLNTDTSIGDNK